MFFNVTMFYLKNSLCAEGRPCAPQGLASLVQSLCGCLLQRLVRKPCAAPCADVFPERPLFFSAALQKTKWSGWKKCLVQCLVQALDGLVRDFLDGWTIRGPMSRGLGQLRKQEFAIYMYAYIYIYIHIQCILRNK